LNKLLFYEFAPATDQDIFKKRGAETLFLPHNQTSAQHLVSANSEYPNCNYNESKVLFITGTGQLHHADTCVECGLHV
jgi:hypothetical protein